MDDCHFCSHPLWPIGPDEHSCRVCGASYAGSDSIAVVQFLNVLCPGCGVFPIGGEIGRPTLECEACGSRWAVSWDGTLRVVSDSL